MLDNAIEQAVVEKIKKRMAQENISDLKSLIRDEIDKADGYDEDWKKRYAQVRIEEALLKIPEIKKESVVIPIEGDLIISTENSGKLVYVKCSHCGYIGKPYHWFFRSFCGVFYFFALFNKSFSFIGALGYFVFTNPYICANCNERDRLVKVLNNRKELPIKSLSTSKFEIISVLLIVMGIGLFFLRVL